MTNPICGTRDPDPGIYQRIGQVTSEWAWIKLILGETLAHFCHADPGAMYVITQNASSASITDWLRTLTQIQVKDAPSAEVILSLLKQIDDVRAERNIVVHGTWRAGDDPTTAWVQTLRWERREVVRDELWSIGDLDDLIGEMSDLQARLAELGVSMGFFHPKPAP